MIFAQSENAVTGVPKRLYTTDKAELTCVMLSTNNTALLLIGSMGTLPQVGHKVVCARIYPAKPGILASKMVTCRRVVSFSN